MHTARLSPRTPFLGRVDIVPHTGTERLSVWGQDVSETGMFVQTTQPFSIGDSVSVRFECDGLSVHVRAATVVWVRRFEPINVDGRSPGIGIRFVSIDPPARAALRRLTANTQQAANDTPVSAHVASSPAGSALPPPALTLPPLSRSIIEAAGGARARDLEDTQDLLPPSSLPRQTSIDVSQEAISLPPLQFTQIPAPAVRAPIVDDNLTSESRVFDGVPAAPRAVTMAPRVRSKPPTMVPVLSMTTSIVAPSAVLGSLPPADRNTTQPMHSLPPADAVDVFAGWTFKKADDAAPAVEPAHSTIDTEIPHAADDVELHAPSLLPAAVSSRDEAQTMPPVDASVLHALQARMASERSVVPQPANETIINPSILMAQTLPPSSSSLDDSFNSELHADRIDAGLDTSLDDDAALAAFSAAERSGAYTLGALPSSSLPPKRTSSLPSQVPTSSSASRRTFQVAAALLVAGCAAGGAVGVLQHLARAPVKPAASSTVALAPTPSPAPVAAVMPVADAEAELFGRQPKKAPVPEHVAVPDAVVVAAPAPVVDAPKVATTEAPSVVDKAAEKPPKVVAEKTAEPVHVAAVKPTKKAPLVARPGRLEVDLPDGGRVKKVFALASPARVVIDLEQARLPQNTVSVDDGGTRELRFGKREDGTQRVVIVLGTDDKPDTVDARLEGDRLIASWKR